MAEAALELRSILESAERAASNQDFASAEQLLRPAVVLQEATLGPNHPELANTLNNLGIVCERLEKMDDAEACYRRAYAIARSTLAADDPVLATSEQNLKEFCLATGRPFETAPPAARRSTAPVRLPIPDPIDDPDPPVPVRPSAAPAPRSEIVTAPAITASLPPPSSVVPTAASAQRGDTGAATVASAPRAASSRRNVAWIVAGSAMSILVVALVAGLSRSGDSAEGPIPAAESPTVTPVPRTEAPPPAPVSSPADRTVAGSSSPRPASTAAASAVDAKLCRTLSTTGWQCTPPADPAEPGVFFFYTRVKADRDTTVQHRWYQDGTLRQALTLRVAANPGAGYRTYSRGTVTAERRGNWTIELRDEEGALLHEERFVVP